MLDWIQRSFRQLFCRHIYRERRSIPGVRVCIKCGLNKGRLLPLS